MVSLNQYNASNVNSHRTRPEFEREMDFYVPVGVILIELKDYSDHMLGAELRGKVNEAINNKL